MQNSLEVEELSSQCMHTCVSTLLHTVQKGDQQKQVEDHTCYDRPKGQGSPDRTPLLWWETGGSKSGHCLRLSPLFDPLPSVSDLSSKVTDLRAHDRQQHCRVIHNSCCPFFLCPPVAAPWPSSWACADRTAFIYDEVWHMACSSRSPSYTYTLIWRWGRKTDRIKRPPVMNPLNFSL